MQIQVRYAGDHARDILMIGPTGSAKPKSRAELARLANAPFVKVEATKFTEVGYVGRDVVPSSRTWSRCP